MSEFTQQFLENGYCFFPGVLDVGEQDQIRRAMDAHRQLRRGDDKEFGFAIHPLLRALAPFLAHPLIIETLRELFDDEVRLVHNGARMSSENSVARLSWHHHYSWDEAEVVGRARPTRALAGFYLDGTAPEVGPFIALPRAVGEPIGAPRAALEEAWPGEVEVIMPPGSLVLFDTALWHAAKAGTQSGMRRTFGAHYQGWSNPRSHPEDNECEGPQIAQFKRSEPRFRGLVEAGRP